MGIKMVAIAGATSTANAQHVSEKTIKKPFFQTEENRPRNIANMSFDHMKLGDLYSWLAKKAANDMPCGIVASMRTNVKTIVVRDPIMKLSMSFAAN